MLSLEIANIIHRQEIISSSKFEKIIAKQKIYVTLCVLNINVHVSQQQVIVSLDVYSLHSNSPRPLSSSIGCLRAVMSLNVHRKRTTASFSFLMGATCKSSHNGVSEI